MNNHTYACRGEFFIICTQMVNLPSSFLKLRKIFVHCFYNLPCWMKILIIVGRYFWVHIILGWVAIQVSPTLCEWLVKRSEWVWVFILLWIVLYKPSSDKFHVKKMIRQENNSKRDVMPSSKIKNHRGLSALQGIIKESTIYHADCNIISYEKVINLEN